MCCSLSLSFSLCLSLNLLTLDCSFLGLWSRFDVIALCAFKRHRHVSQHSWPEQIMRRRHAAISIHFVSRGRSVVPPSLLPFLTLHFSFISLFPFCRYLQTWVLRRWPPSTTASWLPNPIRSPPTTASTEKRSWEGEWQEQAHNAPLSLQQCVFSCPSVTATDAYMRRPSLMK